jgi:predicted double-glycine peptidase
MIKKKYGENIIPTNVAQDTSYFVSGTAYMLHSGLNAHGFTVNFGNQTNLINSQLGSGKPVIVHLTVNTSDGHYVVLKSGSNGNYIMNDPWEGPDLSFSKYYNVNSINQVVTYNQ